LVGGIKNKQEKIKLIISTIKNNISKINKIYRIGPDLYFYRKVLYLRTQKNIEKFLTDEYTLELLYATLISWNMNTRRAKLKYFTDFKTDILNNISLFKEFEKNFYISTKNYFKPIPKFFHILEQMYNNLNIMESKSKFVSNAKLLHFIFPEKLMPMDRKYTLSYFYENTNDGTLTKYKEIINLSFEIMNNLTDYKNYLDNKWNTTFPKVIDNAIIILKNEGEF